MLNSGVLMGHSQSQNRLAEDDDFTHVIAGEEELQRAVIAKQVLDVAILKDALQSKQGHASLGRSLFPHGLQAERFWPTNVIAIVRSVRPGVLGMKKRQHRAARLGGAMDAVHH